MSGGVCVETKIAILDFELKYLTLALRIQAEIKRMVSIKTLLEAELKKADYVISHNAGFYGFFAVFP